MTRPGERRLSPRSDRTRTKGERGKAARRTKHEAHEVAAAASGGHGTPRLRQARRSGGPARPRCSRSARPEARGLSATRPGPAGTRAQDRGRLLTTLEEAARVAGGRPTDKPRPRITRSKGSTVPRGVTVTPGRQQRLAPLGGNAWDTVPTETRDEKTEPGADSGHQQLRVPSAFALQVRDGGQRGRPRRGASRAAP